MLALGGIGCANPEPTPDRPAADAGAVADAGMDRDAGVDRDGGMDRDAGVGPVGLILRSGNLAPVTGRASSPGHNLNGRIGVTGPARATTNAHTLQGGIVAGGTTTSTTN